MKRQNPEPHYEFRVWGAPERLDRLLADMAAEEEPQNIRDCYLLGDDPRANAKIRRKRLKIKRLEEERLGFQRWSKGWHTDSAGAPQPYDQVLAGLQRGDYTDDHVLQAVDELLDELDLVTRLRALMVNKHRRRFTVGSVTAESTDIDVEGGVGPLHTIAIEGSDLNDLVQLRSTLGLAHVPNLPLHVAIDPLLQSSYVRHCRWLVGQ